MKVSKTRNKRRRSLRKETVKVTVEGKESRIHFTLEGDEPKAKLVKFAHNPNLIKFGEVVCGNKTLKAYAFKNNKGIIFIRINGVFIPLNKFKVRNLISLVMKGAWYVGLMGKRKKK